MQRITNHYTLFYLGLDMERHTHSTQPVLLHNWIYMSPYCDARCPPPMLMFDGCKLRDAPVTSSTRNIRNISVAFGKRNSRAQNYYDDSMLSTMYYDSSLVYALYFNSPLLVAISRGNHTYKQLIRILNLLDIFEQTKLGR